MRRVGVRTIRIALGFTPALIPAVFAVGPITALYPAPAHAREPLLSELRAQVHAQISETLTPWKGGQVTYRHLHGAGFTTAAEACADARGDSMGAVAGLCLRREVAERVVVLGSAHIGMGSPLYPRNRLYGEVGLRPLEALTFSMAFGRHGYATGDDRHSSLGVALTGGHGELFYRWLRYHNPGRRPARSAHAVTAALSLTRSSSLSIGYIEGLLTRFEGLRPIGLPVVGEQSVSVRYHRWVKPYEGFFVTLDFSRQRGFHERQGIGVGYVLVIM